MPSAARAIVRCGAMTEGRQAQEIAVASFPELIRRFTSEKDAAAPLRR
jgi:hypothetical protein